MHKYSVVIQFKKQPAFESIVEAIDKKIAEAKALIFALACGFDGAVKKITVLEAA